VVKVRLLMRKSSVPIGGAEAIKKRPKRPKTEAKIEAFKAASTKEGGEVE
jgi:hypothetical protein